MKNDEKTCNNGMERNNVSTLKPIEEDFNGEMQSELSDQELGTVAGGNSSFRDVPRTKTHNYDEIIKGKV